MTTKLGTGKFTYQPADGWLKLSQGMSLMETPGVAVNSKDQVFILTRGKHPVIVCDREGKTLRMFGEGLFSGRPHGIHIGPDDSVYCVDDGNHTIRKFTTEGKLLMTIGAENQPSQKWSGKPFNRPTHVAVSPKTGYLYITDGYGNSRVHKYTPDGRHVLSWGEPGIEPGQFVRPHNVVVDKDDHIYVADRENHRIQIFNADGKLLDIWHDIYRPDGICMDREGYFYVGELDTIDGLEDLPGVGHRVSIYDQRGKLVGRFGHPQAGEGPGQFIAPHGVAVDSHGDLYVGEVSYTRLGRRLNPPREVRSFQKFARVK
jgi:DNA-binding beta-propeller fold protein YncE